MARYKGQEVYGTDLHRRRQDIDEIERRGKARKQARANARVWTQRGTAFLMAGDFETAEANFAKAIDEVRHAV